MQILLFICDFIYRYFHISISIFFYISALEDGMVQTPIFQLKIIVKSCAVFDTIEIYRNKHMNEDIECEFLVMYKDERNRQTT